MEILDTLKNVQITGIRRFYNEMSRFKNVVSLTLGEPDFPMPEGVKTAVMKAIMENKTRYTSNSGLEELREEISLYLKKFNINYEKDEVLVTVGGSEAIFASLKALINKGDKVLIPSPGYPAYEGIIKILGAIPIYYTFNEDLSINRESIINGLNCGSKILIMSFPSNPLGNVLSKEDKEFLYGEIKNRDTFIVSDEIYANLCYEEEYHSLLQYEDIKEKSIYIGGFSKIFSMTGLRIGYICTNSDLYKEIIKVHQYMVTCASSISQYGALAGLKYCLDDAQIMKESFKKRRDYVYERLINMNIDVTLPKGAFYMFPSIKKFNLTSEEFCYKFLQDKRVGVIPGNAFPNSGEGYVRISYANSINNLKIAMDKLESFVKIINR